MLEHPNPVADAIGDAEEPPRSELAVAIAELRHRQAQGSPEERPTKLPVSRVTVHHDAFKVRSGTKDGYHTARLEQALKVAGDLDPILVLPCGGDFVLVDGEYRLAVYRRAGRSEVPVRYFEGTPEEALAHRSREAGKAVLPLTNEEKMNVGWSFVLADLFAIRGTADNAGISRKQVSIMRKAKRTLGDDAFDYDEWWRAREAARGQTDEPNELDEWETRMQEQAAIYADRIRKAVGAKMTHNAEIAAITLGLILGHRANEVVLNMYHRQIVWDDEDDGDDDDRDPMSF
ncbi:ParB/RepB/Spo0J family partition protein [Aurantimonas sp. A2-1-M11]|uniref:ParB/RepB/Spo0J family partition protein n=1 Tax=Aurantimonas sp. A2-1-M11 TaxID=3113712 RepID=UPI002F937CA4